MIEAFVFVIERESLCDGERGVFVGYSRDSYEHVVWDTDGRKLVMIRSIKRVPISESFKAAEVEQINERPANKLHRSTWSPAGHEEQVV